MASTAILPIIWKRPFCCNLEDTSTNRTTPPCRAKVYGKKGMKTGKNMCVYTGNITENHIRGIYYFIDFVKVISI